MTGTKLEVLVIVKIPNRYVAEECLFATDKDNKKKNMDNILNYGFSSWINKYIVRQNGKVLMYAHPQMNHKFKLIQLTFFPSNISLLKRV